MFQDSRLSWNFKFHHHASSPAQDRAGLKPSPSSLCSAGATRVSRQYFKGAKQPLQKIQDGGKKSKMSPNSHLAGTTHLRGYMLQLPVVFPSITIDLLNPFAGNIPTVQPLKSSRKGLLVTAFLCFENNADAQYCFSLKSS